MGDRVSYILFRGKKLALRCGTCAYSDDELTEKNRRCLRCLEGTKKSFVLDKKYSDARQGELEMKDEENEHAQIK